MKKQIIILTMLVIFILLSFSGCFDGDKSNRNNDSSKFIGIWYGWSHYPSFYETWTFYSNMSLKIDDSFNIEWGTYSLNENELVINTPLIGLDDYLTKWYKYRFSENDKHLTLTNSYWEEDVAEFFKEGYNGGFYQKISKFIGKWSNQEFFNEFGGCSNWIRYENYTFYSNFTVQSEYNWCSSGSEEWRTFWHSFQLDENDWLCIGTSCSEYSLTDGNTKLIYQGAEYTKIE